MQARLTELQQQRGRLLERIALQRQLVALEMEPIGRALQVGDRISGLVGECKLFLLQHPLAVAAAVVAVVVLRPVRAWRWAGRGLVAWRTWNTLRGSLPTLLSRFF